MPSASQKASQKPAPFPELSPAHSPQVGSKRKLEDEDEEAAIPHRKAFRTYAEHQKHETHYYLDGNILLQIGKTRFKVHRSRLASESTWFQELVDHYNGNSAEGITVDKDIEDVANEADNVGDDPLFFLDAAKGEDVPTADVFAELLTAIYSGIDYVFNPPSIDEIRRLYVAAWYWNFMKYYDFAHKFLQSFFPAFDKITKEPSLYNAVQAICIAEKYDIYKILPRALHDLARSSTSALEQCLTAADDIGGKQQVAGAAVQPASVPVPNLAPVSGSAPAPANTDANAQKSGDHQVANAHDKANDYSNKDGQLDPGSDDEDTNIIKQIDSTHYTRILVLQRHLSGAWDPIVKELMSITCVPACGCAPRPMQVFDAVAGIRLKYPCDPLLGLQEFSQSPTILGQYCKHVKATMNAKLTARKALICKNLEEKWTK